MPRTKTIFEALNLAANLASTLPASTGDEVPALVQSNESTATRTRIEHLEERLDKLTLVNMAMWSLIRQHTQLSEEDLMERVREIDLIDGKSDGKISRQVARCTKCKRVMSPRHAKCLYCGEEKLKLTAFDAVL